MARVRAWRAPLAARGRREGELDLLDLLALLERLGRLRDAAASCDGLCPYVGLHDVRLEALRGVGEEGVVVVGADVGEEDAAESEVRAWAKRMPRLAADALAPVAAAVCNALRHLHGRGVSHGMLSPECVLVSGKEKGGCRLAGYGLPFLLGARGGLLNAGALAYAPPETLLLDPAAEDACFAPQADVWALGLILAELLGRWAPPERDADTLARLGELVAAAQTPGPTSLWDTLPQQGLEPDLCDFLRRCLFVDPADRDSAEALCSHPFVAGHLDAIGGARPRGPGTSYRRVRTASNLMFQFTATGDLPKPVADLAELDGGATIQRCDFSIAHELRQRTQALDAFENESVTSSSRPPSPMRTRSPSPGRRSRTGSVASSHAGDEPPLAEAATTATTGMGINTTATMIAAMILSRRAPAPAPAPAEAGAEAEAEADADADAEADAEAPRAASVVLALQDLMFQRNLDFENCALEAELQATARKLTALQLGADDLSPQFRAPLWATLLNVGLQPAPRGARDDAFAGGVLRLLGPSALEYDLLAEQAHRAHEVDRQLEQDVGRCHQYHPLVRCPRGRARLARMLKCWVIGNEGSLYWQGLDSVAATVLTLYPADEALAYHVFDQVVKQLLPGMFSQVENHNSSLLHRRLEALDQLLVFHDPELAAHLRTLGVKPDLFAIPWMLTMFAHVFPIPIVWRLWDYFLSEPREQRGRAVLLVAVAVLVHVRELLLPMREFGPCVALLTRLPVALDKLVDRSLQLAEEAARLTPVFVGSMWESQRSREWPTRFAALCPVLPAAELLRLWDNAVVLDFAAADPEGPRLAGSILCHDGDAAKACRSLEARLADSKGQRWIVAVVQRDKALVDPLLQWLLEERRAPFVCLLEEAALSKLENEGGLW